MNWKPRRNDGVLIRRIAERAFRNYTDFKTEKAKLKLKMDILACHLNCCQLDLRKLFIADEFNFIHDIYGISKHINRETAQLEDFFLPRCAMGNV